MLIKSYKIINTDYIYYRIVLCDSEKEYLKKITVQIYQLKCIGAIPPEIITRCTEISTENFLFADALRPNSRNKSDGSIKAELNVRFKHKEKTNYHIDIKIDFFKDNKVVIRDIYLFNAYVTSGIQKKYPFTGGEYKFLNELESIIKNIFEFPRKSKLCDNCVYYTEYQKRGYCLMWHPDTRLT
jgi:hypothetical protein